MAFARWFTPRYRARYVAAGMTHWVQVRSPRDSAIATAIANGQAAAADLFTGLAAILADDFLWLAAEVADQDTDEFNPCPTPVAVVGTIDWTTPRWSPMKRASGLTFSGRAQGSSTSLTAFGLDINTDLDTDIGGNGLVTAAELPAVVTIANNLETHAFAASGGACAFAQQATWKINDRLLADIRRLAV